MKTLSTSDEYVIASRRIAGTRAQKLAQLDEAMQELQEIRLLESAADRPRVQFVCVPRRPHWFGMAMAILVMLALLVLLLGVRPAHAQDPAAPAPPAAAASDDIWRHIKFGATLEGYYQYDGNRPDDRVVPLRAYDTRANVFSLQQAALVVDSAPDVAAGRRFGLRLDLQYGQATETVQGSAANEPRPDVYRNVWQAYGSYVFPVGRGLQMDFGRFGSNLGYETNYAKDNANFSRACLFNFLPFYHMGLRATLPLSDRLTVMYMPRSTSSQRASSFAASSAATGRISRSFPFTAGAAVRTRTPRSPAGVVDREQDRRLVGDRHARPAVRDRQRSVPGRRDRLRARLREASVRGPS